MQSKWLSSTESEAEGRKERPAHGLERLRVGWGEKWWEEPQVLSEICPLFIWDLTRTKHENRKHIFRSKETGSMPSKARKQKGDPPKHRNRKCVLPRTETGNVSSKGQKQEVCPPKHRNRKCVLQSKNQKVCPLQHRNKEHPLTVLNRKHAPSPEPNPALFHWIPGASSPHSQAV